MNTCTGYRILRARGVGDRDAAGRFVPGNRTALVVGASLPTWELRPCVACRRRSSGFAGLEDSTPALTGGTEPCPPQSALDGITCTRCGHLNPPGLDRGERLMAKRYFSRDVPRHIHKPTAITTTHRRSATMMIEDRHYLGIPSGEPEKHRRHIAVISHIAAMKEGEKEVPDFVPTRHELAQLFLYWAKRKVDIDFFMFTVNQACNSWRWTSSFASLRLDQIEQQLGAELCVPVWEAVEADFAESSSEELWRAFKVGDYATRDRLLDAFYKLDAPDSDVVGSTAASPCCGLSSIPLHRTGSAN